MTTIDAAKIVELRGLLAKATPGPWKASNTAVMTDKLIADTFANDFTSRDEAVANAALIAAMKKAFLDLLDVAERLKEVTRERDQWQQRESETQEALQAIGEDFGAHGGEPRTDAMRRLLTEAAALASRAREDALREAGAEAKTAWLHYPRGEIGDADHDSALCEYVAERIALIDKPKDAPAPLPAAPVDGGEG